MNRIHSCEGFQLFRIASVPAGMPLAVLLEPAGSGGRSQPGDHEVVDLVAQVIADGHDAATRDAAYPAWSTPWSTCTVMAAGVRPGRLRSAWMAAVTSASIRSSERRETVRRLRRGRMRSRERR